jgi:hypothetical protein
MAALAALQSITLDEEGFVSCSKCAMPMPLEAVAPASRANNPLTARLKLTWADCVFQCGFYPAFDCCNGVHMKLPNGQAEAGRASGVRLKPKRSLGLASSRWFAVSALTGVLQKPQGRFVVLVA